jgi:ribosomal protein S12 methylthiotransferase
MALQRGISKKRNRALIGREFQVLVEGPSADSSWCGKRGFRRRRRISTAFATSQIPASIPCAQGEFRTLRVVAAHDYDLTGELIDTPRKFTAQPITQENSPFVLIS